MNSCVKVNQQRSLAFTLFGGQVKSIDLHMYDLKLPPRDKENSSKSILKLTTQCITKMNKNLDQRDELAHVACNE